MESSIIGICLKLKPEDRGKVPLQLLILEWVAFKKSSFTVLHQKKQVIFKTKGKILALSFGKCQRNSFQTQSLHLKDEFFSFRAQKHFNNTPFSIVKCQKYKTQMHQTAITLVL